MSDSADMRTTVSSNVNNQLEIRALWKTLALQYGCIVALFGLAISGPVLEAFAESSAYFLSGEVRGGGIVQFLALWVLVLPLLLSAPIFIIRIYSARLADVVFAGLAGVLGSMWLIGLVPGSLRWSLIAWLMLFLLLAALIALAVVRSKYASIAMIALLVGPFVSSISFLSSPGISTLIENRRVEANPLERNDTPVVQIIFDEMSLGMMLNPNGTINETLFPNFAQFASESTWYPNARSVAGSTVWALQSLVAGRQPDSDKLPVAADFQGNLFSIFGEDVAFGQESVSRFCTQAICRGYQRVSWPSIAAMSLHVAALTILPDAISSELIGPLPASWGESDFHAAEMGNVNAGTLMKLNARPRAESFQDGVSRFRERSLFYIHFQTPHGPFQRFSDGRLYQEVNEYWLKTGFGAGIDPNGEVVLRQRVLQQSMYADTLLGDVLTSLKASPIYGNSLVVVASDHGLSIRAGHGRRNVDSQAGVDDVMAVPLFVKYPMQTEGRVDGRDAPIIDVLPTVAEVVGAQIPDEWSLAGVSLLAAGDPNRPIEWFGQVSSSGGPEWKPIEVSFTPDPSSQAERNFELLGTRAMSGAPMAIGPHADVFGNWLDVDSISVNQRSCEIDLGPREDESIGLSVGRIPAFVSAKVQGVPSGTWVAGVLNGVAAGLGPVYKDSSGDMRVDVLLDYLKFVNGKNSLALVLLDNNGTPESRLNC